MAELISTGTSATGLFDVTVTNLTGPKALFMKVGGGGTVPYGAAFELAHKAPDGNYSTIALLDVHNIHNKGQLTMPGTYGVRRLLSNVSVGMDVEG